MKESLENIKDLQNKEEKIMTKYLKKHGLKEWNDDKAAQILFNKHYDELDEDERSELEYEYWDFVGQMSN